MTRKSQDTGTLIYIREEDMGDSYADDTTDPLQLSIETALNDLSEAVEPHMQFKLSATFNGYENGIDSHYYFDSLLNLRYSTVSWSSEGTSGNYTYYFDNGKLVGARESNYYQDREELLLLHADFKPNYGVLKTEREPNQHELTYLSESDFITKSMEALSEYQRLIKRVKEYKDSVTIQNEVVKLQIQNVVNYGEDFTEQENFEMSRKVYDVLIRDGH